MIYTGRKKYYFMGGSSQTKEKMNVFPDSLQELHLRTKNYCFAIVVMLVPRKDGHNIYSYYYFVGAVLVCSSFGGGRKGGRLPHWNSRGRLHRRHPYQLFVRYSLRRYESVRT